MPAAPAALLPASRFSDITVDEPDLAALLEAYASLQTSCARAATLADWLALFSAWDALRRRFSTWSAFTELRFRQDTRDAAYKAAVDRSNELQPKVTGLDAEIKRAFLASALRKDLERELGDYVFARWETDVTAYDPSIEALVVSEANLVDEYTALLAQASFEFQSERLNLSALGKFGEHPDRGVRRAAAQVKWDFYGQQRPRLDALYDRLVGVRHEMAQQLGFATFVELGYRRLTRTDYGPADVERYRNEIVREIVPLAERIHRAQARKLGIDEVMLWDEQIYDRAGSPKPPGDFARMLTAARNAFAAMHPDLGSFAAFMTDGNMLDLQLRDGKAGGGFCTSFPTYGLPYVFANFNGSTHDVNVLLHEMGHAFQCYSSRAMPVSDYLWPTAEACEIHSMSMEFLAWPQLRHFFGSDAQGYRLQHLSSSIAFLPYGAAVDHFQHLVYERPDATPAERHGFWKQVEALYLPWRRYGDIEHLRHGGYWQQQQHIYSLPFYYIDYTLALGTALQFWMRSLDDYDAVLRAYTSLCRRGGEAPFQTLVRSAGLTSPFEPGVLHAVAERAAQVLGL